MAGEFGPFVLLGEPETLLHEEVGPDKIKSDATDGVFNKQVTLMIPFTRSVMETAMALDAEHDMVIVEHEIGVMALKNYPAAENIADISIAAGVETTTIQDMKHWKYQGRVRSIWTASATRSRCRRCSTSSCPSRISTSTHRWRATAKGGS